MAARSPALWLLALSSIGCAETDPTSCVETGAYLDVDTASHRLYLCEAQVTTHTFDVRLGFGGIGKTKEGDQKTPLGNYPLGAPRASEKYGTFIPIGYPTAAQHAEGFTGSAVGVHGPDRRLTWLGAATNWLDTTDGCIGLATDEQMSSIATWIGAHAPKTITIR